MARALAAEGAALLEDGRPDEAVEVLRRAVAAGEPAARDLLVRAYLATGHWHCVVDWLGPLVGQGEVGYARPLGVALAELGDVDRAEDALRTALAAGDTSAANDLAILLHGRDRFAEAVMLLTEVAEAGDPHAGANLSSLMLERGDVTGAEQAAQRYLHDSRPETYAALADARAARGRHEEAAGLYRRAVELGAVRAHTAYAGFLLDVQGDAAGCERELRAAEQAGEPGSAANLGRFLVDTGRAAEGRGYLERAVASGDGSAVLALAEVDGEDPYED